MVKLSLKKWRYTEIWNEFDLNIWTLIINQNKIPLDQIKHFMWVDLAPPHISKCRNNWDCYLLYSTIPTVFPGVRMKQNAKHKQKMPLISLTPCHWCFIWPYTYNVRFSAYLKLYVCNQVCAHDLLVQLYDSSSNFEWNI